MEVLHLKRKNRRIGKPVVIIVAALILVFSYLAFFGCDNYRGDIRKVYTKGVEDIRWGIDISGGVEAIFSPDIEDADITDSDMDAAKAILETRLVNKNITDYEVYTDYDNHNVIVRFPLDADADPDEATKSATEAVNSLGEMALLTFYKGNDNTGDIVLQGADDIKSASAGYQQDEQTGSVGYIVELNLTDAGASKFDAATAEQLAAGGNISIYMDDVLISCPKVNAHITDGKAIITGMEDDKAATDLANKINAGALPFALTVDNSKLEIISPTLGEQALKVMLIAGIAAFAVICLMMILRYRLIGAVACIALLGQAAGMLACVSGFFKGISSFTLTLPGIAGIILSIGFGVDANVITAERIKEEFKKGKTIDGAISQGYTNAFSSILDGNLTNVIIALVLLAAFGTPDSLLSRVFSFIFPFLSASVTGNIYSFGFTLITGVIFNFIMGVWASKFMLMSISRFKVFRRPGLYCAPKNYGEPVDKAEDKKPSKLEKFDFVKTLKKSALVAACVIVVLAVFAVIVGPKLDITFSGGSRYTYSYTGTVDAGDVGATIKSALGVDAEVTLNSGVSDDTKKVVITVAGDITKKVDDSLLVTAAEEGETEETANVTDDNEKAVLVQDTMTKALTEKYPDNAFELSGSNSVNPTLASSFFIKALVAVLLAAVLIVLYMGIRFRKIGGVSAAVTALTALVHDVIISFLVCVVFGLEIDTNFFAVVLTLLGYSLNATIVIFDRVRENRRLFRDISVRDCVNKSIKETLARSIMTSLTTVASVLAIIIVAEAFGVTTLRSFAIPMAAGILAGCFSSVFFASPLWVYWQEKSEKKAK